MKYEINYILRANMTAVVEAKSLEEAENKLYGRTVLGLVMADNIEESDIDIISMKERKN